MTHPFEGMIAALNAGKFDALMAGLMVTPEREVLSFFLSFKYDAATRLTDQWFGFEAGP